MTEHAEPQQGDPAELVHARYIGETDHVMPDLALRPRCCQTHEQEAHAGEDVSIALETGEEGHLVEHAVDPRVLIRHGDVILLDRYSAEGRDDFEIVAGGRGAGFGRKTKAELADIAAARGVEVDPNATKAELIAALEAPLSASAAPTAPDDPTKEA